MHLQPWFPDSGVKIGEAWFEAPDLLIKFLFTTENLSVQVHPNDSYARQHESSLGKTEMWHILRAEPGAKIALGFKQPVTRESLRAAAATGEIMDLLEWHAVQPGDTYLVPAGTVHAIGAGLALCEIQEISDITYRLYDYGRPRALHLERGAEVSDGGYHPGRAVTRDLAPGHWLLVDCEHFRTELFEVKAKTEVESDAASVIILSGAGRLLGERVKQGEVWRIEPGTLIIEPAEPMTLIKTGAPPYRLPTT